MITIKELRALQKKVKRRIATFEKHGVFSEQQEKLESRLNVINNEGSLYRVSKNMSGAEKAEIAKAFNRFLEAPTFKEYVSIGKEMARTLGIKNPSVEMAISMQESTHQARNYIRDEFNYQEFTSEALYNIIHSGKNASESNLIIRALKKAGEVQKSNLDFSRTMDLLGQNFEIALEGQQGSVDIEKIVDFLNSGK